jgi:hypothetical protein
MGGCRGGERGSNLAVGGDLSRSTTCACVDDEEAGGDDEVEPLLVGRI